MIVRALFAPLESLPLRQRRVQQLPEAEGRALMSFDFRRRSSGVKFDGYH
jgi:hypothetical protein